MSLQRYQSKNNENMNSIIKTTIVSILLAHLVGSQTRPATASRTLQRYLDKLYSIRPEWKQNGEAYARIDAFLVASVHSDDIESNLAKAREWLEWFNTDGQRESNRYGQQVKLLEYFVALEKLNGGELCEFETGGILLELDRAMENAARIGATIKRINSFVLDHKRKHLDQCMQVFKSNFHQTYATFPRDVDNKVGLITNQLLGERIREYRRNEQYSSLAQLRHPIEEQPIDSLLFVSDKIKNFHNVPSFEFMKFTDEYLLRVANEPEVVIMRNIDQAPEGSLSRLFEKYLLKPCERYYNTYKRVFAPAQYTLRQLKADDLRRQLNGPEDGNFFKAWAKYYVCDLFVNK